jgi:hypothetical protein
MTDASMPSGAVPEPDADPETRDARGARDAGAGRSGEDVPGAPGSDEPMTDSTDGGLEGGDPGVEE